MHSEALNLTITIVSDASIEREIYRCIITALDIKVIDAYSYPSLLSHTLKSDVIFFDITTLEHLEMIHQYTQTLQADIILLSPFSHQESIQYAEHLHTLYLAKPLQKDQLTKIIRELKAYSFRKKYLSNKVEVLNYLVDDSPVRMAVYDLLGNLVYANSAYLQANNIDNPSHDTTFNKMVNCQVSFYDILFELSKNSLFISRQQHDRRWYKSHFYYIRHQQYVAHICSDETQTHIEIETLKKEALFFKHTSEGVIITDDKGVVESVNSAFCSITGYTQEEIIGKPTSTLSSGVHTNEFYEHMWDNLKHHGRWQGEIWNRRKNGEIYPEWLSISKSVEPTTNKVNYLALFSDISSIKDADKKIQFYANHDHLTGLLNKVQFGNMLKHTIATSQRANSQFALMFLDLDHFKEVNDSYGHNIGDILLKTVASRFLQILRKEDILARIGGDEFNIIIQNIYHESDAMIVAQKLVEVVKKPIIIEEHHCQVSLSVGIALYPRDGANEIELTKHADAAMYEVKNGGRDGVMLYQSKFTDELIKRVSLQNDLKKAISQDDIEIYFQPVLNREGKLISTEILARWRHAQRGFVPPDEFIEIAEEYGIILDLGQMILQKAFEKLPIILAQVGSDFTLAINISAREFYDPAYNERFLEMADDFAVVPKHIELEITETHIMQDAQKAISNLEFLKSKGFMITIDDFGTGYSSLNYLKLFPISKLKIDKSFVLDALSDNNDRAIVESIIQLAKIFKLKVQAEGVETKEHLELLMQLGCDNFQGYYCAKPLDFDHFIGYIKENRAL